MGRLQSIAPKKLHLDFIDGLRGLAILLVMMDHWDLYFCKLFERPFAFSASRSFFEAGSRGVLLFFLVSSYTLFNSSRQRFPETKHPYQEFYLRRFFRLAPLWTLSQFAFLWVRGGRFTEFWCCFFLLCPLRIHEEHLFWGWWSLFCEESFYFFLPLFFPFLKSLRSAVLLLLITLLIRIAWLDLATGNPNLHLTGNSIGMLPPAQWFAFAGGICLFYLEKLKLPLQLNSLTGTLSFVLICFIPGAGQWGYGEEVVAFCFGILFLSCAKNSGFLSRFVRTKFLRELGISCYSIYLFHLVLIFAIRPSFIPWLHKHVLGGLSRELVFLATFPFFVGTMYLIGKMFFTYLEKPCVDFGKKVIAGLRRTNG